MARGKKLSRQLGRYFASEAVEQEIAELIKVLRKVESDFVRPETLDAMDKLPAFLEVVDATYDKYEEYLAITERNLTLSSEELLVANRSINSMVNSLGQGFLMFDETGQCSPVYSKASRFLLDVDEPAGKHISEVLRLDQKQKTDFDSLLTLVFCGTHAMSFDEIMRFAPRSFRNAAGAFIQLDYKADKAASDKIDRIVVIATDMTNEVRAQELADQRKTLFESMERILRDRQSFGTYIRRASEFSHEVSKIGPGCDWKLLQREAHTLKGGAGVFRLTRLTSDLHDLETEIGCCLDKPSDQLCFKKLQAQGANIGQEITSIIDHFKQLLGVNVLKFEDEGAVDKATINGFANYLAQLGLADVRREYLRQVCAQSLTAYLRRYDLVLNDLAERFNKKIKPTTIIGTDVPVILDYYQNLFESFVHIFRNIMDHGIETPEERREAGKEEAGQVVIVVSLNEKAAHEKWIVLNINDDGGGIDLPQLRAKLAAKDPEGGWSSRGIDEVLNAIFTHSISTRDDITSYSGRGIGMGAVYDEVKKLGGNASVTSIPGQGTTINIEVPYRLERE